MFICSNYFPKCSLYFPKFSHEFPLRLSYSIRGFPSHVGVSMRMACSEWNAWRRRVRRGWLKSLGKPPLSKVYLDFHHEKRWKPMAKSMNICGKAWKWRWSVMFGLFGQAKQWECHHSSTCWGSLGTNVGELTLSTICLSTLRDLAPTLIKFQIWNP